jgi:hypothetical protein
MELDPSLENREISGPMDMQGDDSNRLDRLFDYLRDNMTMSVEPDPNSFHHKPSTPSGLDDSNNNRLELLKEIWEALESLCSPDLMDRISGFQRLIDYDAVRQLPIATYVLATRLTDPDIDLRTRIARTLGCLVNASQNGGGPSESVEKVLLVQLSAMRTREVFALLQVVEYDRSAESCIADLFSYCSFAGEHLSQILSNRSVPAEIRRQAAYFIGLIGYLDALPVLERLALRFEKRSDESEVLILPALQNSVQLLTAL